MDSQFYGMPYYIDEIQARLSKLTVGDVNAAIRKYLSTDNYAAVLVTANAKALKETLREGRAEPEDLQQPGRRQGHGGGPEDRAAQGAADPDRGVPVAEVFQK